MVTTLDFGVVVNSKPPTWISTQDFQAIGRIVGVELVSIT